MSKKIVIGDCFKSQLHTYIASSPNEVECLGGQGSITVSHAGLLSIFDIEPIPTLHLPIGNDPKKYGGAWFDLILSGEKK